MNFNDNLQKFQKFLKESKIDFYLVLSNDEFLSESAELNENPRYLLSGFSGTAGDMLILQDKAYLFVDGRYHIQVDEQTDANFITPIKLNMGERRNDKILEILKSSGLENPTFALPSNKISISAFEVLEKDLAEVKPYILKLDEDCVCKFFATTNKKKVYKVWKLGIETVGKSFEQKLKELSEYENDFLLVFSNDEICYLANIRSDEIPFSSSLRAFGLLGDGLLRIFCDLSKIPQEVRNSSSKIIYLDFSEFEDELNCIDGTIFYEPSKTPLSILDKVVNAELPIEKMDKSPIGLMKAVKNETELGYIRECYRKSDLAILDAIKFLNQNLQENKVLTCGEFMDYLFAAQTERGAIGLSFKPIFALNERSAIIHCTDYNEATPIKEGDLILLDYGVYFEGGYATDMTRTFVAGAKYDNELLKKVYTTVLRAFLNTLNFEITKETTFFELDKRARDVINEAGLEGFNFNHGTGHGIGLNVHEHPPVLAPSKLAEETLQANMVFSIEPGLYKENVGGVRIENSVCTVQSENGIKIETLTNLPFDEKLIIFDMLNEQEKTWLKEYSEKALQ